ncbi:MAG TPA: hypothetical protein VK638_46385 [Edaphobacter sp.]|nr:hypothetical protein [Edaphobacter sp.]
MFFMHSNGWSCQFLEMDLKTSLLRKRTFASVDKVRELVCRVGVLKDLADKQGFEHGIQIGRGGVYLDLTAEQYAKLKKAQG